MEDTSLGAESTIIFGTILLQPAWMISSKNPFAVVEMLFTKLDSEINKNSCLVPWTQGNVVTDYLTGSFLGYDLTSGSAAVRSALRMATARAFCCERRGSMWFVVYTHFLSVRVSSASAKRSQLRGTMMSPPTTQIEHSSPFFRFSRVSFALLPLRFSVVWCEKDSRRGGRMMEGCD